METILEKLFNLNKEECFIDKGVVLNIMDKKQEVCLELVDWSSFQMLQLTWLFHKVPVLKVFFMWVCICIYEKRICIWISMVTLRKLCYFGSCFTLRSDLTLTIYCQGSLLPAPSGLIFLRLPLSLCCQRPLCRAGQGLLQPGRTQRWWGCLSSSAHVVSLYCAG